MANEKTLGDYLRMMNDIENDQNREEEGLPEEPLYQDGEEGEEYDEEGDSYDMIVKDIEQMSIHDEEPEDDSLEESFDSSVQDLLNSDEIWTSGEDFLNDVTRYIKNFDKESLTEGSPYPDYNCDSYLIIAATLADGLMIISKCYNDEGDMKNLLFYVKEEPIFVREIDESF